MMGKKAIQIKNLSFAYPDGTEALSELSLDIVDKESVAVIGPNGAGKSTLLLHLNGLLGPTEQVNIFERPATKKNLRSIRQQVGFVFQDPQDQLFMPTVFEDVAFGPKNLGLEKEMVQKAALNALEIVSLLDKKDHLSHHLSLGEQKRLSIATVLSMSCQILVLDEPNSNLDLYSRRHLIHLLKDLDVTKVIATHDLEMVLDLCSRTVILDKGGMIADGPTREILSNKTLLESHGLEVPYSLSCNI